MKGSSCGSKGKGSKKGYEKSEQMEMMNGNGNGKKSSKDKMPMPKKSSKKK